MARKKSDPEKTIGKEQTPESANGASPEEAPAEEAPSVDTVSEETVSEETSQAEVRDKTDEIAATYDRAKRELNEAVTKLRGELTKLDVEKARQQARTWVEENPTLATLMALGAGIVVGKVISEVMKPPPPPTLSERVRSGGQALVSHTKGYAHDVGDVMSERAAEVGEAIARRARELGEDVTRRARDMGADASRQATKALAAASEQTSELKEDLTDRTSQAGDAIQNVAEEIAGALSGKVGHGRDVFDSLFNAAKTVAAAMVVKKVTDWVRRGK